MPQALEEAVLSLVSPSVAVALIAAGGVFWTARAAFADVTLKRRMETAQRFTELAETANNVSGGTGLYSQIAALELIASFGRDEPHLRDAARAILNEVKKADQLSVKTKEMIVSGAATSALARLPTGYKRPKR